MNIELEKTNSDWSSHCRKTTIVQETGTNLEERDAESEEDIECEAKENYEGLNGTTRTVTLQTLMSANILHPGKSLMTIDYLGQKFVGDLMPDGKIKSHETETIFLTPSAWAMHCKRIINPEKKSGCGWGSVKYKGKKLDTYKNSWLRKCALQKDINMDDSESEADKRSDALLPVIKRIVCPHNTVLNRNLLHDGNMLIKADTFNSTGRVQPFLVTFNSSALLLADFHCHLTMREVCGYFGGHWDINTHTLVISKTYPCRNFGAGTLKAAEEECNIRNMILQDQLLLVGWYHSHPKFQAEPSLRDCDAQLDYQIRMRGSSDVNYTPCISTIISPYFDENPTLESVIKSIWIIPPNETKQILEYGRPMLMQYTVLLDEEMPEYVRSELQSCVLYYTLFRNEFVRFNSVFIDDITFIEKLKNSLYSKFPTNQDNTIFWSWICDILGCTPENVFIPPKAAKFNDNTKGNINDYIDGLHKNDKLDKTNLDKKGGEIKVMSLQEQLCLPSGLNMNPVRTFTPLAASTYLGTSTSSSPGQTSTSSAVVTTSTGTLSTAATVGNNTNAALSTPIFTEITPHNSPITVPSSSASPVKSDQPIQGSPLSPKPEILYAQSQSPKNQMSANLSIGNISNKYGTANQSQSLPTVFPSTTNDLVAASLAQLAGQLAPNFLPKELANIFQPQADKNFGNCLTDNSEEQKNESKKLSMSNMQEAGHVIADSTKNKADSFLSKASNLFKTKLMRELDKTKNDPTKINELMRSSEYATLLLQQAEALGATTLGTLGLGQDLNFISSTFESKNDASPTDQKNIAQASKLLGYDACIQLAKSDDINAFIQQQMGAVAAAALANVSVGAFKNQKHSSTTDCQADYGSLLQTYSKLFGTENSFRGGGMAGNISGNSHSELSAVLSASADSELSSFGSNLKSKDITSQNQQRECDNQNQTENLLLYQQNKTTPDLGMLFASSSTETNLTTPNKLENSNGSTAKELVMTDPSLYFNSFSRDKSHEYPFFQQQNIKQDGNFFISPDAIMKIQKDSLSAIMMKPPKSTSAIAPTLSHTRDGSTSPAIGRLTPVKSAAEFASSTKNNMKYNFSAMDLAVSSIQPNTSIGLPIELDHNLLSHRRPSNTPPVDLSRFYSEGLSSSAIGSMKKRMEYSSVAELAAPPPAKMSKVNENTHSKM